MVLADTPAEAVRLAEAAAAMIEIDVRPAADVAQMAITSP
jgi:hypothetical protein